MSISLVCNLYRLPVASLTAGLNIIPITENFTVFAVITAHPAKRHSVSDTDVSFAGSTLLLPLARHYLHASQQLVSHLDWREPIGLQERSEGRSSHNR